MAANPQSFFRFAARYYPLLLNLFYRREGFTEADLRNLVEGIASRAGLTSIDGDRSASVFQLELSDLFNLHFEVTRTDS